MMTGQSASSSRPLAAITGASSGIGAVFAEKLAARGCDLLLIARRKDRLEQQAAELAAKHGILAEPFAADLVAEPYLRGVEERLRAADRLEFLVNNAGFGTKQLFHESDLAEQDAMHRLHVLATLRLTHAALPGMVARNRGAIINVSSVAGFMSGAYGVSYCATKAWMNTFSESLMHEMRLIGSRVMVQALCPGLTKTEFHQTMGLDRGFVGESWWMEAGNVVDASLTGIERGESLVIPGWRYKLSVAALRHLPRSILRRFGRKAPNVRRAEPRASD